ncbi:hypothetical protein DSM100688_1291 [Bifidobacterium ramosum]|uniref:Uncharacterized protein n=1 Tax=Bifidobacterium ramosum TaxID=1798158 RepID=A0A6L4WZJ5_9BIFI|nr:hypothetical protein [Bifidobacterium ramosum]KAB8287824.1 hypothetical protein DSM100688_1291 [Bifidobacterium ramosum]NEG71228.1 hypothetical protein [Bifidobacterium ramosum]
MMTRRIRSRKALRAAVCMALAAVLELILVMGVDDGDSGRYPWSPALHWITFVMFLLSAAMWLCAAYSETAAIAFGAMKPVDERDREMLTKANAKALQVLEILMLAGSMTALFAGLGMDSLVLSVIGLTVLVCGWLALALQVGLAWWYQRC